jgi:hypothetical protein
MDVVERCKTCVAFESMSRMAGDWGYCLRVDEGEHYSDFAPLSDNNERIRVAPEYGCVLWKGK